MTDNTNYLYCKDKELSDIINLPRGSTDPHIIKHNIRERVVDACELAASRYDGDICEIGAKTGLTTVPLCKIAQKYSKRVVAVDPWELGVHDCYFGEYETFLEAISPYKDIVDILRGKSQDTWVISALQQRKFSFVFIDALHYGWAICGDIKIFKNMEEGIIAVDDVNHVWIDALGGFLEGAEYVNRIPVHSPAYREGYLIK